MAAATDSAARRTTATPTATTRVEVVASIGSEGGFDAQKIYKDEAPGVVTVVSLFGAEGGEGSGFVLNGDGEIVTNAHVVTTGEGDGDPARLARSTSSSPTATAWRRRCSGTTRTRTSRCCASIPRA